MFLEKIKFFIPLLGFTALFVAGNAAFFSVFGLSKLFAGATVAVIFMASSLELAKLVTAAYLYRYWGIINTFMKSYLLVGVITLILITSAGIFGFLSNAYQGATIEFEKQSTTLLYKEDRLEQLEDDKVYLKDELVQSLSSLPDNYITAKRKLREDYNPKVLELNDAILKVKQEVGDLKVGLIETGVDVGPAIYLARTFNTDIDTVVKFFIFILIFVFDPLAVSLVVAYQVALTGGVRRYEVYNEKKVVEKKPDTVNKTTWKKEKVKELKPEPVPEKKPEIARKVRRGGIGSGKT
ncbi:hypothetical protein HOE22_05705 [Candidatus Woesearchaeota archaeon]|nr:hypothetical protein [Candidatus Woesearchaeota archaeon]MBT7558305.1 hypothetical protein [Candidatus Woesearchaeota archaeon]